VGGRCKCNGHASRCVVRQDARRSVPGAAAGGTGGLEVDVDAAWRGRYSAGVVGGHGAATLTCDCRHNTEGVDCERCRPFYHDRPWARATAGNAHECTGLFLSLFLSQYLNCSFAVKHRLFFCSRVLDLGEMILIYELDLDVLKMCPARRQ